MRKLNIRIIAALLLLAAMVLGSFAAAFAADPDYTGELNPETNEPIGSNAGESSSRDFLAAGMFYDWKTHDFVYPVENSLLEVHASVADGMITNNPVSVTVNDPSIAVYCNGTEVTSDFSNLREPGSYMVSVRNGGGSVRLIDFTIVGDVTNEITQFTVPEGFYISAASRDDENVYEGRYTLDMEKEGKYEIEYKCGPTDYVYNLSVVIDRTPPALNFQARLDKEGRVHSAVSFSGLEKTDSVVLLKDGTQVQPLINADGTGKIVDSGNYIMRVYDAAGNMKEYQFTIMVYFNAGSWVFILAVLAVIAAVAAYVIFKRRSLKIG